MSLNLVKRGLAFILQKKIAAMDSSKFRVPIWSPHTLPHRGQVVTLQISFAEILAGHYAFLDRQQRNRRLDAGEQLTDEESSSSSSESDRDYILPGGGVSYGSELRQYLLRPRVRVPLADITPIPQTITAAGLDALGFERVKWDE